MATKTASVSIQVPQMERKTIQLRLIGDSPLISHRWSDKAKQMMLDKQMKKASAGREAKNPWQDYCDSMYWISEQPKEATESDIESAQFGFPAVAFKAAAVGACRFAEMKMTEARGAFHVVGELIPIKGKPQMREDMVRIGMGTADIRYRGEVSTWEVEITVVFNANAISAEQIVNLFNVAGFGGGVGEWRPEKNGSYGRFHVATTQDGD